MQPADVHLRETKQSGEKILEGKFLQAYRDVVSLPDGSHATREYVVHPGAVMVIPLLDTPEGLQLLKDCSPIHRADKIVRPLLIGQGANDPRVKQAESDQIVAAMAAATAPVGALR